MSKRNTGLIFYGYSVIIFSSRYIAAAIYGAAHDPPYWAEEIFVWPLILGFIFLGLGTIYLGLSEYRNFDDK